MSQFAQNWRYMIVDRSNDSVIYSEEGFSCAEEAMRRGEEAMAEKDLENHKVEICRRWTDPINPRCEEVVYERR